MPLFALLLPILFLLSGFAINLAYMQLCDTELKIATDATAHAAGRTMSEWQRKATRANIPTGERRGRIIQETYDKIEEMAQANLVAGKQIKVALDDTSVEFGVSRQTQQMGMYEFEDIPVANILGGSDRASSVGITGSVELPLVFQAMRGMTDFSLERRSIATQVDRDIALVLDRSGSMLHFMDEDALSEMMDTLYSTYETKGYQYWNRWTRRWEWYYYQSRRISSTDRDRAKLSSSEIIYDRLVSQDVVNEMYQWLQEEDDSFANQQIYEYLKDWKNYHNGSRSNFAMSHAPDYSRWHMLTFGVEAFLDVLGGKVDNSEPGTDQKELVSLVTFNSNARVDLALTDDDTTSGGSEFYGNVRDEVTEIVPFGGTGIGTGLATGLPPIVSGNASRPFAAKTIVVLTDGENTAGDAPLGVVEGIVQGNAVTVHTVTFSSGADQEAMMKVAKAGGGSHYHAEQGGALIRIFEEIANNLPTILTE